MTNRQFTVALFVLTTAWACASKAPPPSEAPAAASASGGPSAQPETATATAAAEQAPAPSDAPSASTEAPAAEPKPGATEPSKTTAGAPSSDKSSGHMEPGGYTGDDPCVTKTFHYGAVKAACHSGGRKAAKTVMKGAVKKAKEAGQDLKCTSCHEDMSSFHLKSNAVADLKQWL